MCKCPFPVAVDRKQLASPRCVVLWAVYYLLERCLVERSVVPLRLVIMLSGLVAVLVDGWSCLLGVQMRHGFFEPLCA